MRKVVRKVGKYIFNILVAIDQLANTILAGDPDETISSRVGKRVEAGTATLPERYLATILDWLDPNHVIDAIERDEGRNSLT